MSEGHLTIVRNRCNRHQLPYTRTTPEPESKQKPSLTYVLKRNCNRSRLLPQMHPYRNLTTNQFFPVYWNCQQCSCENCLSLDQGTSSCSTQKESPTRPSFTIEALLSRKDERKPNITQCPAASSNMTWVTRTSSSAVPGEIKKEESAGSDTIHDHNLHSYLPFQRPTSFGLRPISLFGRGNMQANGELI